MLIKAGVDISRLKRNIRRSLGPCQGVYAENGELFIITSTFEGTHSPGSLHYANQAYDLGLPRKELQLIIGRLKKTLGYNYDVVLEKNHIHIEYDPK